MKTLVTLTSFQLSSLLLHYFTAAAMPADNRESTTASGESGVNSRLSSTKSWLITDVISNSSGSSSENKTVADSWYSNGDHSLSQHHDNISQLAFKTTSDPSTIATDARRPSSQAHNDNPTATDSGNHGNQWLMTTMSPVASTKTRESADSETGVGTLLKNSNDVTVYEVTMTSDVITPWQTVGVDPDIEHEDKVRGFETLRKAAAIRESAAVFPGASIEDLVMFPGKQTSLTGDDVFDTSPAVIAIALWVIAAAALVIIIAFSIAHKAKLRALLPLPGTLPRRRRRIIAEYRDSLLLQTHF